MIDYFTESEKLLSELAALKSAVENMQTNQKILGEIIPEPPKESKKSKTAVTEEEKLWLEYQQIAKRIKHTQYIIDSIEQVIQQLTKSEQDILRYWYIDRLPKEKILAKLHYESITTLYKIKNKAVKHFALLYFGASVECVRQIR